ncbi:MAG: galactokinase [Phycisphaerales bacterium]
MSGEPRGANAERRAREAFIAAFGRGAEWMALAPGRVNLIGEHIDYCGGHVLPIAIDRRCVVAASATIERRLRVVATDIGERIEVPLGGEFQAQRGLVSLVESGRVRMGSWASYVLGVAAGVRGWDNLGRDLPGAEVAIASDVPIGGGLSSSAALEVATAMALARAWDVDLSAMDVCRIGREAERNFAGVPCGIMDQWASVLGRDGHAVLIDCASEAWELVPMFARELAGIIVVDTGVRHALASGEYAKRRAACERAANRLGVRWLCAASIWDRSDLPDDEARAARHATSENRRTLAAVPALRGGDVRTLGSLMNESHKSLRNDYRVSCVELDLVVDAAACVPGVHGARMTGGGFGGCAIVMLVPGSAEDARRVIGAAFRARFGRECGFMAVRASDGATCERQVG